MIKTPMTVRGAEKLREELEHLKTVQRPSNYPGNIGSPCAW